MTDVTIEVVETTYVIDLSGPVGDLTAASAAAAAASVLAAQEAADDAQAWAEGSEPGGPGTYSAKETAESFGEIITYVPSLNLASPATLIPGKYIASNGTIVTDAAWSSLLIPCSPSTAYSWWSNTDRRVGSAFLSDPTTYISATYSSAATPGGIEDAIARTTHASAAYIWINLGSNVVPAPTETMVNLGSTPLDYEEWHAPVAYVPLSSVLFDEALPVPEYAASGLSPQMYDKDDAAVRIDGSYVASNGTIANASGWAFAKIPRGDSPTVTVHWGDAAKRQGLGFAESADDTAIMSGTYNAASTSPLVLTWPDDSTHLFLNVQSSTQPEPGDLMVNEGATPRPWAAFGERQTVSADYIEGGSGPKLTLSESSSAASTVLSVPFGDDTLWQALSPRLPTLRTASDVFNFHSAALGDVAVTSNATDDVAPAHIMGTTIGANHGWVGTNCTKSAHGKTSADIGSIYAEGGVQWKIWDVPSANVVTVTAVVGNAAYTGTTLTHVSGGTNTASLTPTGKSSVQIYPSITQHRKSVSVDGVPVESGTFYPTRSVTFSESYNIPDKDSLVSGTPADKASLSMANRFDMRGGCTIYADFFTLDTISAFQDLMFLQAYPLAAVDGVLQYLIPDTAPFNVSGTDYDFTKPVDMSGALASALVITPARIADPDVWPSRVVQWNGAVGEAMGYLPYGDTADDVRPAQAATQALEVRDGTKKIYLHAVNNPSTTALAAGDYFGVVGYRVFFDLHENRTAGYVVEGPDADWLFLDWHASIVDQIDLPAILHGRAFTEYRKTTGVTIHGARVTDSLRATVTTTGGAGRYAILRFAH